MSGIPQIKCESKGIILNKNIRRAPIDEPIEFDYDNDHNDIPSTNQCSTQDSEFSTVKVKDEIKLEDDEMGDVRYESIFVAENYVLSPMTPSMTNVIKPHNKKNSTNGPNIVDNTDSLLKPCSTQDTEFSTVKVKDEIKLEDDEMDDVRYESSFVAKNYVLSPMTPSMTIVIKSPDQKSSTQDSEFSTVKVKDEIKLEDDEMDGISNESILVAENDVVSPMTPSMSIVIKSPNQKSSTQDSEFSTVKVKDEIKLEDDEMDDVRYESIFVAKNYVVSPMTSSMPIIIKSPNQKSPTQYFEFSTVKVKDEIKLEDDEMDGISNESILVAENDVVSPMTPSMSIVIKSSNQKSSTQDSEFSTVKVKDEIKLEDDEMDDVRYESIFVAENDVVSPMTSSMPIIIKSPNQKSSSQYFEFSTVKVKDEIKLEDDEIDDVRYENILVAENDVVSPMTSSMPIIIKSPNQKSSSQYFEFSTVKVKDEIKLEDDEIDDVRYENILVAENDVVSPMKPSMSIVIKSPNQKSSTQDSEFSTVKVKDEIKLEDDEMDDVRYESIFVAENYVLSPMTPSMTNIIKPHNKNNSTNGPNIIDNTDSLLKSRPTQDSEFSTDKVNYEIILEDDEINDISNESILVAENDVVSPMTPPMVIVIKLPNQISSTNGPNIVDNTDSLFKSRPTQDSEFSTDKVNYEIILEDDEINDISNESILVAENDVVSPMTPPMTNVIKSHNNKNSTDAPKIVENTDTSLKSCSTKNSESSTNKMNDEIKLVVDEIDSIRHENICVAENVVLSPMTALTKKSTKSNNKKISTKAPKIVHNTDRPFKCDTCKKTFIRKEHLKTHELIHTGKKPYKCETCDKSFTRKDNFKSHQKVHTGEKPFTCAICNKSFLHKGHIRAHIRIHTGERPYKCNVCGKLFLQEGHLRTHEKIHSGERPYKCNRCYKSYSRKDNLISHKKIHLGEKPFQCDICKKDFLQKGHVRIHIRTHTGEKPFKCVYCNKTFSRKDNMKDHIGRLHTN